MAVTFNKWFAKYKAFIMCAFAVYLCFLHPLIYQWELFDLFLCVAVRRFLVLLYYLLWFIGAKNHHFSTNDWWWLWLLTNFLFENHFTVFPTRVLCLVFILVYFHLLNLFAVHTLHHMLINTIQAKIAYQSRNLLNQS